MTTTLARGGLGLVVAAGLALLFAVSSPAAAPGVSHAKGCHLSTGDMQSVPHGYLTSLSVHRTSCGHGKSVERSFQRCRRQRGHHGRCTHRVLGYRCSEHRQRGQGVQSSRVACHKGRASVDFTYSLFV